MDHQAWFLRTSKLALALAIIRSKPADKSSREYTEHLARVVSGRESKWRSKVEALEAEVLQLRQKLVLSGICSGLFKSGECMKLPFGNISICFISASQLFSHCLVSENKATSLPIKIFYV